MSYEEESAILGLMALGRTRDEAAKEYALAWRKRRERERRDAFEEWMNYNPR